ncbi:chondroitin sulfate proteoglycan 4-like [Limulus polyphemus]|uniref:Chondroitin sulfate proteoglycan 4-like n=1 Tax=Limulus polyphemus TaxID=6850 RepID=A0ABM1C300_LIMPO|nr:chondroitin sulfate proteoglycan 4-like [Limulus polyphemus]
MQQSLTKDHLSVTTNDKDSEREIVYYVRKEPEKGRILLENPGGALSPVTQFTQGQVDKNMLLYEHTKPMKSFTTMDTIIFDIETQHADSLKGVAFNIEISVDSLGIGNLEGKIQLNPLDVMEGGHSSIGPEHIDLSRLLTVWQGKGKEDLTSNLEIIVETFPTHGWLSLNNENISESSQVRFNRTDIRDRLLVYHHDDSDTFGDVLTLGFYISGDEMFPHILLYNGTLQINVTYVNDQPFELITKTPKINVVQGQKMVISSDNLYTKDLDGVSKDIIYEIISNATNGFVVKEENETHLVQSFTQEDIDKDLVYFVHDGSKSPGTFHFKVSDGKHKPVYKAFNIIAVSLSLTLVNKTTLEFLQGTTTVTIKPKNLGAATNGDPENILYNVTKEPRYGRLFIGEQLISQFKQKDINNGSVSYMQLDMTASQDYFVVAVTYGENILSDRIINVTVVPLIKQGPFGVHSGDSGVLTLDVLDASKLAEQTDSDPVYSITKQPKYGYLQKVAAPRVRREAEAVKRFTHHDIIQEIIIYKSKDIEIRGSVADVVEYVLTAPGVQPARGRFVVILQPKVPSSSVQLISDVPVSSDVPPNETTLQPALDDREQELEENVHTPQISDDHLLIICLVVGVVVLTLAIVLVIKYLTTRQRSKRSARGHIDGKVPGSQTAQTDLNTERFPSNGSGSLSELPPAVPPTSPSSLASSCSVTPKRGVKAEKSENKDVDPTLPPSPPPYGVEGNEWTEVSPTVPTCKVTPLTKPDRPEVNETTLNAPYNGKDPSEPSGNEEWSRYEGNSIRYGASNNPILRKNQYWV